METETKAKCRVLECGKIECRTKTFGVIVQHCVRTFTFVGKGGFMYFNKLYCVHICIFSTVGWSDYCMVLENFDFNPKIGKKKQKFVF